MTTPDGRHDDRLWAAIEEEKRRDGTIKRVNRLAWGWTVVLVVALAALVGVQVIELAAGAIRGDVPWMAVAGVAMPLVIVLGILGVLIGVLTTIAMFLRLRTASLSEIQRRLAALEELMTREHEATR